MPIYILPQDRGVVVRKNVHPYKDSYYSNYSPVRKKKLIDRVNLNAHRGTYGSNYRQHQENKVVGRRDLRPYEESYRSTLDGIGNGLSSGKIASFFNMFGAQIYLNLPNGVSAYYSSNQAYYVIQDFLKTHQALSLNLNDIHKDDDNVYAMGTYYTLVRGRRESSQIYISLKLCGNKWQITQITIN
jgi:hypothetical protein